VVQEDNETRTEMIIQQIGKTRKKGGGLQTKWSSLREEAEKA
jgi:hypothetical protein